MLKQDERPQVKELTEEELEGLYQRIEANKLTKEDADSIKNLIKFTFWIQKKFKETGITLFKLKSLIFGSKSEKRDKKKDKNDGVYIYILCEGFMKGWTAVGDTTPPFHILRI